MCWAFKISQLPDAWCASESPLFKGFVFASAMVQKADAGAPAKFRWMRAEKTVNGQVVSGLQVLQPVKFFVSDSGRIYIYIARSHGD